jgi:hypothetical protein
MTVVQRRDDLFQQDQRIEDRIVDLELWRRLVNPTTTKGDPGVKGDKGDTGAAGAAGVNGADGARGAPGGFVYTQLIGTGAATTHIVNHNLGTRNVTVSCYRTVSPYDQVEVDVERTSINSLTLRTNTVLTQDELTVIVNAPGSPIAVLSYVHTQATPAAVWTVNHNLGMFPNITVVGTDTREILADVSYPDAYNIVVEFSTPTDGKAYVS